MMRAFFFFFSELRDGVQFFSVEAWDVGGYHQILPTISCILDCGFIQTCGIPFTKLQSGNFKGEDDDQQISWEVASPLSEKTPQ